MSYNYYFFKQNTKLMKKPLHQTVLIFICCSLSHGVDNGAGEDDKKEFE